MGQKRHFLPDLPGPLRPQPARNAPARRHAANRGAARPQSRASRAAICTASSTAWTICADLGITALYLNPIFASAANHRYHTYDYYQVDPLLGGNDAPCATCWMRPTRRGMRVVLDGVFNHASRGFLASSTTSWRTAAARPTWTGSSSTTGRCDAYQHDADNPPNYAAWWDLPALPKFNTDNPGVREYPVRAWPRYWIEFGIDGWRLDVPDEIDDDEFWREFRRAVKGVNPEAYIVGEIWDDAQRWLQGDQFDAVMNYLVHRACAGLLAGGTTRCARATSASITALRPTGRGRLRRGTSTPCSACTTGRSTTPSSTCWTATTRPRPDGSWARTRAPCGWPRCFQMTMPGAPCIYYGDEIGMSAGDDPDCRERLPLAGPGGVG